MMTLSADVGILISYYRELLSLFGETRTLRREFHLLEVVQKGERLFDLSPPPCAEKSGVVWCARSGVRESFIGERRRGGGGGPLKNIR